MNLLKLRDMWMAGIMVTHLLQNQGLTFQIVPEHVKIYTDGDKWDKDYLEGDALIGPSIDDLVIKRCRARRRLRSHRDAACVYSHSYEVPNHLNPKLRSANLAFTLKDYDRTEGLLSVIIKKAPVLLLRNELLVSFMIPW